jgi:putative endonuclease
MSLTYWIYILASRSRNLYTGVTNDLQRRMIEHRQGRTPGFTSRYKIFRLVHWEQFADIRDAIAREKEIKGWRREKKLWLIQRDNPTWQDFAESFAPSKSRSLTTVPANRGRVRDDKDGDRAL